MAEMEVVEKNPVFEDIDSLIVDYLSQYYKDDKAIELLTDDIDVYPNRTIRKKVTLKDIEAFKYSATIEYYHDITIYCKVRDDAKNYRLHISILSLIAYTNRKCNETYKYIKSKENEIDIKKQEF